MRALVMAVLCCVACNKKPDDVPPTLGSATRPVEPAKPAAASEERWAGTLVIGAAMTDFVVKLTRAGDRWTAALEGPAARLPIADITYTADRIAFTVQKPKAPESSWEHYDAQRKGNTASGTGTINGTPLPFKMVQLADGEGVRSAYPRPQTPKPPFPYASREVTVDAPDGGKLAGTLTLPKAAGPAPAVLLWSGSGQQDRDETIYNHKPFAIIADRLTRDGFAVLRLDDRATGKTVGALGTLDTEIADAGAAIDFLAKQKEVDPKRVGMIAHSTGGMVAPNVALAHPVAFIVSLAGVAIPGRDLVLLQSEVIAKITGVPIPPETTALQKKIGEASLEGVDAVKKVLVEATQAQIEKATGRKGTPEEIDQAIAKPLAQATQPWSLSYFRIDPREAWKQLSIPVLLVVGDKDTQVPADATIAALTKAHAKPAVVTTKKLPGLNHLFQHASTGMTTEYLEIEESFDPATLDTIAAWLATQARSG